MHIVRDRAAGTVALTQQRYAEDVLVRYEMAAAKPLSTPITEQLKRAESTTGYVFLLFDGSVSWQSRLQHSVATSTVEAEYMAASAAAREAIWLRKLMSDLGVNVFGATVLLGNNQGAQALARNPLHSGSQP
ncbi:hypothetical protein GPECTOR_213g434 [Gonium pectorale]|uniref:Reverse transcriptase Ty1/copia-type domain-containing protein n=1 Tax=Gonium pectorale TaxID=33097 RepID=A0A150FWR6_GONPE|nr:hypothetical protein GPECTOR_213g434 [Gonium pectorale]|eukprot:KXZ42064.1 hypothetical protein GPECTOR_213g434 [Gonium pectorale]